MPSLRTVVVALVSAVVAALVLISTVRLPMAVVLTALAALAAVRLERLWRTELRPTARYWWGRVRAPDGP